MKGWAKRSMSTDGAGQDGGSAAFDPTCVLKMTVRFSPCRGPSTILHPGPLRSAVRTAPAGPSHRFRFGYAREARVDLTTVDFVHDLGELPLFADQAWNRLVKGYRKAVMHAAGYLTGGSNEVIELKQRESQFNGLAFGDRPGGVDKHALGADVAYNIPEGAFLHHILHDDVGGPPGMVTLIEIMMATWIHFMLYPL